MLVVFDRYKTITKTHYAGSTMPSQLAQHKQKSQKQQIHTCIHLITYPKTQMYYIGIKSYIVQLCQNSGNIVNYPRPKTQKT